MRRIKTPKTAIKLIIFCLATLILTAFISKKFDDKNYNVKLQIINASTDKNKAGQRNNFVVKIAQNEQERETGLMWIKNLPENYGMLFQFENEQMIDMWMKNTKIALDMIFINKQGEIVSIKHQAKPESLEIISSEKPALQVLEINGGMAEKLGIKVGDKVLVRI